MKRNQAWGWLVAAVMAAGLNASYHNGDLQWVHRVAEQAKHRTVAVLALASGRADLFLAQAQVLAAHEQADSRLAVAMTPVQAETANSEASAGRVEALAACKELQRARMEIQKARLQARIDANVAHFQVTRAKLNRAFNPMPVAFNPMKAPACPRIRVVIPQIPGMRMPAIHVNTASADPV
jgi:hypothetical protein